MCLCAGHVMHDLSPLCVRISAVWSITSYGVGGHITVPGDPWSNALRKGPSGGPSALAQSRACGEAWGQHWRRGTRGWDQTALTLAGLPWCPVRPGPILGDTLPSSGWTLQPGRFGG